MGANVTHEQMEHVNAYRDSGLAMMQVVLANTSIGETHEPYVNVARARDQLEMINDVMLVEIAKCWYTTFWPLWTENNKERLTNEVFITRFEALEPTLPAGCTCEDVSALVQSLEDLKQVRVIDMFTEGMHHVSKAQLEAN